MACFDRESSALETALGIGDPHTDAGAWQRNTRSLGQVPTPPPVAKLMARWVMSIHPHSVMDPAAGLGSLLYECHRLDPQAKLTGIEQDRDTFLQAKNSAPRGTQLILADYLLSDAGQFPGIVANPPYVKAHRLDYPESAWSGFERRFGASLDRLTNLYALFLLKIWADLVPGGRAALIVPAEFLNANFGKEIKEQLLKVIRPPGIVVFNPSLNLFDASLTTSAIVFLEKGRPRLAPCKLTKADSLAEAEAFLGSLMTPAVSVNVGACLDLDSFQPNDKWLNPLFNGDAPGKCLTMPKVLGDYFNCRRGIATGANDFFCLSQSGLLLHGLELCHVDSCISKAADAEGLVFTPEKYSSLVAAGRRCYLLNPRQNGPSLASYLQIGERLGIPQRHLPSHRPVWYLPENRHPADIWVAVFSRTTVKYILTTSGARNLTCFHGLYAKPGYENMAPLVTLYLNSSWGRDAFAQVNRFYGDGLNKLEPKDVEALPCPEFPRWDRNEADRLVKHLLALEPLPPEARLRQIDTYVMRHIQLSPRYENGGGDNETPTH
jgi:adenine-specific DNA-methyltransferase